MLTKLTPLLAALAGFVAQTHAHGAYHEADDEGEFDDYEEGVTRVQKHAPPESLLDFLGYLAPVLKYYVVLLGLFAVARYFNRMLEAEGNLKEKELTKRPNLTHDLMRDSDEEEDEEEEEGEGESDGGKTASTAQKQKKQQQRLAAAKAKAKAKKPTQGDDDEVYEELTTDGARLVKMTESELKERKKKSKNHPLFEGLQKIEEELRQKKEDDAEEEKVSWNELHHSMLKRYQQKYPEHGLRVQKDDDYDDEFKELLKKHNIDPEEIRREIKKDALESHELAAAALTGLGLGCPLRLLALLSVVVVVPRDLERVQRVAASVRRSTVRVVIVVVVVVVVERLLLVRAEAAVAIGADVGHGTVARQVLDALAHLAAATLRVHARGGLRTARAQVTRLVAHKTRRVRGAAADARLSAVLQLVRRRAAVEAHERSVVAAIPASAVALRTVLRRVTAATALEARLVHVLRRAVRAILLAVRVLSTDPTARLVPRAVRVVPVATAVATATASILLLLLLGVALGADLGEDLLLLLETRALLVHLGGAALRLLGLAQLAPLLQDLAALGAHVHCRHLGAGWIDELFDSVFQSIKCKLEE